MNKCTNTPQALHTTGKLLEKQVHPPQVIHGERYYGEMRCACAITQMSANKNILLVLFYVMLRLSIAWIAQERNFSNCCDPELA